jgi:glycosyltransferase involved in cell wall biosynthesis
MKPRILFFFSALAVGGAERQSIGLAAELGRRGYDCGFLCFHSNYAAALVTDAVLSRTTFVDGWRFASPAGALKAWHAIARAAPDLLVAVGMAPLRLSAWGRALRQCRTRIVCTYHTTVPRQAEWMREALFRWSLPLADCLVYVSERQREYWEPRGLRCPRVEVIPNGVDTAHFTSSPDDRTAARQALGFREDDYVVGLLAMFRPEKNHGQLVDAVAALRARGIPAKALFVGDGQTRRAAEAYARVQGVAEHAVFAGERRDVRPLVAAMDVGVLCSVAVETLPLSALEIMAMGVPMVMSDTGGASEIIDGGDIGRLFPVGDTAALVEHLAALTDRPLRQSLAASAATRVRQAFTVERMADRYEMLFQSLLSQ